METPSYYWAGGRRVPLVRDPEVVALKFRPGPVSRIPMDPEAIELLRERLEPVAFIEHRGIKIYRTDRQTRAVEVLGRQQAIEFATPAFHRSPGSDELMFVTGKFLVKFRSDVSQGQQNEINDRYGVNVVEKLNYADNAYMMEPEKPGRDAITLANLYVEREPVDWAHPVLIRRQAKKALAQIRRPRLEVARDEGAARDEVAERVVPVDRRWHLGTAQTRVTEAWALPDLTPEAAGGSSGIRVAILDDGIDVDHPDIAGRVVAEFDFEANVADARPKTASDNHGTACAGVALAAGRHEASGAAPGCSIIAVRTPSFLGVDEEAQMFEWTARQGADVISCSWGYADGTGSDDPLPDNIAAAFEFCVTHGRGGKGIPIFWAAGNGDESVSLDGYAACPNVIAVAASTSRSEKAWYSDYGPEIWVCAPSSGDDTLGELSIFTTDRRGAAGYNGGSTALGDTTGDYTGDFGGTSSAAPLAAGIGALVLSANPDLHQSPSSGRGREVSEILAATAQKIGDGYTNGHSPRFGFGRIDAAAAVAEALRRRNGGGPEPGAPPIPTITGPANWPPSSTPPGFSVDPGPGRFFAIEVTTDPAWFADGADLTSAAPEQAYASWSEFALFPGPADYGLPQAAWERLGSSGATLLYYRAWASDSASDWVRATVSTDGDGPGMIDITGDGRDAPTEPPRPRISASPRVSRDGPSPIFWVDPGANRFFAVEVMTARGLRNQENSDDFFASWSSESLGSATVYPTSYQLPPEVWDRLKVAPVLYYRAWGSDAPRQWVRRRASVEDAEITTAAIEITDVAIRLARGAPGPSETVRASTAFMVTGPDTYLRTESVPPAFHIEFTQVVACRVEVALSPDILGTAGTNAGSARSDVLLPEPGFTSRTWRLPESVWQSLSSGEKLYYRAVAEADAAFDEKGTTDTATIILEARSPRKLGRVNRQIPRRGQAVLLDESRWRGNPIP